MKLKAAQLKRCKVSISRLKSQMKDLKQQNSEIDSSAFEDKIKSMPIKQQQDEKAQRV